MATTVQMIEQAARAARDANDAAVAEINRRYQLDYLGAHEACVAGIAAGTVPEGHVTIGEVQAECMIGTRRVYFWIGHKQASRKRVIAHLAAAAL